MARDDEARYGAAVSLITLEGDRLFQTFGAFLLASTVLAGFLLSAVAADLGDWATVGGAAAGLLLCLFWLASYERHTTAYNFRMALAREAEPDGWELIAGRGKDFSAGQCVTVGDEHHRLSGIARWTTRGTVRSLVGLFAAGYTAILAWSLCQVL